MEAYASRDLRLQPNASSLSSYEQWRNGQYEIFLDTIGRYPSATGALEPKSVPIYDEPEFRGYRVSIRVYDGVHAYGILLVPSNIKPGEKRPVVFTQHGLGGKPEEALGVTDDARADAVYSKFGRELVRRGYIVFAPLISVQTNANRNALVRRAHLVGLTPVGVEVRKASRVLDYLETLPFVDKDRFAFYGLSYGGFTALWTGPAEPRFKVVICSGYFNDWNLKTTDLTEGTSFLFYKDTFDMFNFDILNKFDHAGLASLVPPRAFMVEIGSRDGIIMEPRRFVDAQLNRVTELYINLGISEKARIARFDGPHKIHGVEAYAFLDRMLSWVPSR
jgi:dienelactone hydrolase